MDENEPYVYVCVHVTITPGGSDQVILCLSCAITCGGLSVRNQSAASTEEKRPSGGAVRLASSASQCAGRHRPATTVHRTAAAGQIDLATTTACNHCMIRVSSTTASSLDPQTTGELCLPPRRDRRHCSVAAARSAGGMLCSCDEQSAGGCGAACTLFYSARQAGRTPCDNNVGAAALLRMSMYVLPWLLENFFLYSLRGCAASILNVE